MQYALLIYLNEAAFQALPPDKQTRRHQAGAAWFTMLVQQGKALDTVCLQPTPMATTLRGHAGSVLLTDGPFAETKEVLGGFVLLEAADLDEAIRLAHSFPGLADGDTVELRPVLA